MADAPVPPEPPTRIRVRYAEVDRMGYLWHGHYLAYFEQARTDWLRARGTSYRDLEDSGTLLVVVETGLHFRKPAAYDEEVLVHARLTEVRGPRLRFEYEVRRDAALLATGFTVLASTDRHGRPCRPPEALSSLLPPGGTGGSASDAVDPARGTTGPVRAVQGGRQ